MKKVIVDFRINNIEKRNLNKLGYDIILCPPCNKLYEAICGHPDIQINIINSTTILIHKDMNKNFINKLKSLNFNIVYSEKNLKYKYPYDIILNAVNTSDFFIHNLKYTDNNLLNLTKHKKLINVKQGYTKCSTAIVNSHAAITSDTGIATALTKYNIDVLLLPPGDILLQGLNYGFIGGCCGLLEKNLLAFYGDLNYYAYKNKVIRFLNKHNVKYIFLRKGRLIDRGSIISLDNIT